MSTDKKICSFYQQGNCKYGDNCNYYHPPIPCRYFLQGSCKNGDQCTFSHNSQSLKEESPKEKEFVPREKNFKEKVLKNINLENNLNHSSFSLLDVLPNILYNIPHNVKCNLKKLQNAPNLKI